MTTKFLKVNFDGDVGNISVRAVAGDANSRKLLLNFGHELSENSIVRLYVKKAEHVEYVEAEGNKITLSASMLERAGVYPAQIEVLEKDGDEVKSVIQTRAFNLNVEKSITGLDAIEGTTKIVDLSAISEAAQNISGLIQNVNSKESALPDAGDNPETKFLNGKKEWSEIGAIQGEKGDPGNDGQDGKSAYQLAVDDGFQGSLKEWQNSLKGEKGNDGKSPYDLAVENGFSGTLNKWLESLKGEKGDPGENGTGEALSEDKNTVLNVLLQNSRKEETTIAKTYEGTAQQGNFGWIFSGWACRYKYKRPFKAVKVYLRTERPVEVLLTLRDDSFNAIKTIIASTKSADLEGVVFDFGEEINETLIAGSHFYIAVKTKDNQAKMAQPLITPKSGECDSDSEHRNRYHITNDNPEYDWWDPVSSGDANAYAIGMDYIGIDVVGLDPSVLGDDFNIQVPKEKILVNLVDTYYAQVGKPFRLYLQNLVHPYKGTDITIVSPVGQQKEGFFEYTPHKDHVGTHQVQFRFFRKGKLHLEKTVNLVVSFMKQTPYKVHCIGDSYTEGLVWENYLLSETKGLELLGTRGYGNVLHNGVSGAKVLNYVNDDHFLNYDNEFRHSGQFDYSNFCTTNNIEPDYTCIMLGVNDFVDYRTVTEEYLQSVVDGLVTMVESIHAHKSDIKVLILISNPPSDRQDFFTMAYSCNQHQAVLHYTMMRYANKVIETFRGKEGENIYCIGINASMDLHNDFANAIHPSEKGYGKIGAAVAKLINSQGGEEVTFDFNHVELTKEENTIKTHVNAIGEGLTFAYQLIEGENNSTTILTTPYTEDTEWEYNVVDSGYYKVLIHMKRDSDGSYNYKYTNPLKVDTGRIKLEDLLPSGGNVGDVLMKTENGIEWVSK